MVTPRPSQHRALFEVATGGTRFYLDRSAEIPEWSYDWIRDYSIVAALQKVCPKQTFNVSLLKPEKYQNSYLAAYIHSRFPELRGTFVGKSGTISSAKNATSPRQLGSIICGSC